jgi:hypothetical protein
VRRYLPLAVVCSLLLAGCSSSGRVVVRSEPPPQEPGSPPHSKNPGPPPEVNPPLPYGHQGPVASIGVPPGHYPPPGMCRVWLPGTPPGHQPAPQLCSEASSSVPLGAWLVRAPKDGLVEVLAYDERDPDVVVMISWFDAGSGNLIASDEPQPTPSTHGKGNGKGNGKGKNK